MTRLDVALVEQGLAPSRARAQSLINADVVTVNGLATTKASLKIKPTDDIALKGNPNPYVSRAALKLVHALDHFQISVKGAHVLDIGASTGGFTQVCILQGAKHVTAIDVGHDQMAPELINHPQITNIEGLNAKQITEDILTNDIDLIVSDLSFISLKKALPAALDLAQSETQIITLIKPQFEVGRENIGKKGIVSDPLQHQQTCNDISDWFANNKWHVMGITDSPITGGDGNREFLIAAKKS